MERTWEVTSNQLCHRWLSLVIKSGRTPLPVRSEKTQEQDRDCNGLLLIQKRFFSEHFQVVQMEIYFTCPLVYFRLLHACGSCRSNPGKTLVLFSVRMCKVWQWPYLCADGNFGIWSYFNLWCKCINSIIIMLKQIFWIRQSAYAFITVTGILCKHPILNMHFNAL